jgi:DNA-binding NtrC family response regulator
MHRDATDDAHTTGGDCHGRNELMKPNRANILVVEDNPGTRELMASLLTRMGSAVTTAASVDEAMQHLRTSAACDLVVADIVLPGTSGLELARSGRRVRPGLPVIFVSGYPEAVATALEYGAITVPKPVTWNRLRRVIQEALDDSPLRDT